MDGGGDADLRDSQHGDGDRFPDRDQMDHQRRRARESSREIAPVDFAGGAGVSASARFQRAADCAEQYVRAKSHFRSAQRFVFAHSIAAAPLVRQSRYGRFDDSRDRRCELGRARPN